MLAAPRGNRGGFSALFSTAESGKNDYTSGLNLDLGPLATKQLSVLNVESAGCTPATACTAAASASTSGPRGVRNGSPINVHWSSY